MASAWGSSWGSAWGNSWGTVSEDEDSSVAAGGGFAPYRRQHWGRRRFEDFLKLEASEPAIARELQSLALKAANSSEYKLSAAQMQTHLSGFGVDYNRLYQSIYIGLVLKLEKEQEQEFEVIAQCMAALL